MIRPSITFLRGNAVFDYAEQGYNYSVLYHRYMVEYYNRHTYFKIPFDRKHRFAFFSGYLGWVDDLYASTIYEQRTYEFKEYPKYQHHDLLSYKNIFVTEPLMLELFLTYSTNIYIVERPTKGPPLKTFREYVVDYIGPKWVELS